MIRHGVLVNETRILSLARRAGRDWWFRYRQRHDGRIVELGDSSIFGGVVWVPCDSADDASWLHRRFAEVDIAAAAAPLTVTGTRVPQTALAWIGAGMSRDIHLPGGPS